MARRPRSYDPGAPVIVMDVGNTTISIATWQADRLKTPLSVSTDDDAAIDKALTAHLQAAPKGKLAAAVIGSVVPEVLPRLRGWLSDALGQDALVVGDTIPLPMEIGVDDPRAIGVDRVCASAAAFNRVKSGCIVVDFGTAVTIDLIDDEGILLGGAILPGLASQFHVLHERTAQLPVVDPACPPFSYGRNTIEAIQTGVCRGLAGAVRWIVEGYATALNRWPQVLATGGDLAFMAPQCDFIDTQVPHLTLHGIGLAYTAHLAAHGV